MMNKSLDISNLMFAGLEDQAASFPAWRTDMGISGIILSVLDPFPCLLIVRIDFLLFVAPLLINTRCL